MSDAWLHVTSLALLKARGTFAAQVGTARIGMFFVAGEVYAIDNLCTHGNACLTDGALEGHLVECPLHAGLVDLRSGKAVGAPITRDSRTYPVKVEQGEVFVAIEPLIMAGE